MTTLGVIGCVALVGITLYLLWAITWGFGGYQ